MFRINVFVYILSLFIYIYLFLVFANKRVDVVHELRRLDSETEPIVKIMSLPEVAEHIEQSKDGRQLFDTLSSEYGVRFHLCEVFHCQ